MSERAKRASRASNSKTLVGLEKLKKLRSGESRAIDNDLEEEAVYEYVDEDEYSELIKKRTDGDWIVDDGGADYYEDGREIFDDVDEPSNDGDKYAREYDSYNGKGKKRVPLKRKTEERSSKKLAGNLKSYLVSNQKNVAKKSFDQLQVEDDDLLKGILDDISTSTSNNKAQQQRQTPVQSNKRKRTADLDEDLIPTPTANNPFSVATETNSSAATSNGHKKARITEELDDMDDDSLLDSDLPESAFNTTCDQPNTHGLDFEIRATTKESERSFTVDSMQFENDENIFEEEGVNYLNMYWLDVYEDYKQPGTVYLFGKVYVEKANKYLSCCIICRNVEHKIYVYPRTHFRSDPNTAVTMDDVESEIKQVLFKYKIKNFRSRPSVKNYAFEKDIVSRAEYLEVLFQPPSSLFIPTDLAGDTFSHVFNYNQSSLERFIIDLKLKGPGWLRIRNPISSSPPISWCKFEYALEKPFAQIQMASDETLAQREVPLSFMTFSLKTYMNPEKKQNEIIAVSCLINREYYISKNNDKSRPKYDDQFCLVTKAGKCMMPMNLDKHLEQRTKINVKVINSERELISLFITRLFQNDPDLLIGHDLAKFEMDVLLSRLAHFKLPAWSKLGRLRRTKTVPVQRKERYNVTVGRLLCDTVVAAQELIRAKSYDLNELSRQVLKKKEDKPEIVQSEIPNYYKTADGLLTNVINVSMNDTMLINQLFVELNVIPLYEQITKIAGNIFSRTLLGGRSERNEYLLLHAFHDKGYILPEKKFANSNKFARSNEDGENAEDLAAVSNAANKRKKAAYTGGLVLEPKVGFYDKYILLMDFNSLYPSIIQEYKICFTTIDRASFLDCLRETDGDRLPKFNESLADSVQGILPAEISNLVRKRREVKIEMCKPGLSEDLRQQYDIQQKALKLTANSMYGCLGFSNSRFYARPLAALITAKGREILRKTKDLIETNQTMKLEIIYGDTDSLMINTNKDSYDEAESIGYRLKADINKQYQQLEIDIDGIFKSILLLKKKKYAAMIAKKEGNQIRLTKEVKGLDIVRRDWSVIAKRAGERVLDEILSADANKPTEKIVENIHSYLASIAKEVNEKRLPNGSYVINVQLTKNPEEYSNPKGLCHVQVAKRMNEAKKRSRPFKKDDTIPYVICRKKEDNENFNTRSSAERAFHIEELKEDTNLEIDAKYYLKEQIYPVVNRLCDPIEGTDAGLIAEFLGVDVPAAMRSLKTNDLDYELLTKSNETRYDTCKPLVFTCPNRECKRRVEIRSLVERENRAEPEQKPQYRLRLNFERCPGCSERFADERYRKYFVNHLKVYLRSLLSEYYQTWLTCEDPVCKFRTRRFTSQMTKRGPICPECTESVLYPEITDAQLYLQFSFFIYILDTERVIKDLPKVDDEASKNDAVFALRQELAGLYKSLLEVVKSFKDQMAYDVVDLTYLFINQLSTNLTQN